MLKDLFSNRLFIGALAFFVLMVVGGTLYLRHIQRQDQIALERTQERLKQWEAQQKQTEKVPEGDTTQDGHFHADGTWHAELHEADAPMEKRPLPLGAAERLAAIDWENLTPNDLMFLLEKDRWPHLTAGQREIVQREFYAQSIGVDPPQPGYYYRVHDDGTPVLDENGKPRQFKEGEPIITIKKVIGFAPTREQYQRHKRLRQSYYRAYNAGNHAEADRLLGEIKEIEAASQGEVPVAFSSIRSPVGRGEADRAAAKSKVDAAIDEAYREMGLGYMVDSD